MNRLYKHTCDLAFPFAISLDRVTRYLHIGKLFFKNMQIQCRIIVKEVFTLQQDDFWKTWQKYSTTILLFALATLAYLLKKGYVEITCKRKKSEKLSIIY